MVASLVSTGVDPLAAGRRADSKIVQGLAQARSAFDTARSGDKPPLDDECWRKAFQALKIWTIQNV